MARKTRLRKLSFTRRGDTLVTKLLDVTSRVYFKKKADISNKKQMRELMEELKSKGVNFPSD